MSKVHLLYGRFVSTTSGPVMESAALLAGRVALAAIFWRSGRTKVAEGSWLEISDTTRFLFETEYSGVPLPSGLASVLATYAEHALPILLVLGLGTRFAALGLAIMTVVIQLFVYPDAWWTAHFLWLALAGLLFSRGGGLLALDALFEPSAGRHESR